MASLVRAAQVFVGTNFVEDLNMLNGQQKSQLVAEGRLAGNGPGGKYDPQLLSLVCPCSVASAGCTPSAIACGSPSNQHGSNTFNRTTNLLELVIGAHGIDSFIEVQTIPVVAISMSLSVSVEDFYRNKAAFISSLASLLGINPLRITVVDVVPGSRRSLSGRRAAGDSAAVSLEIVPDPVVGFSQV